jgi:DNA-binding transcriptional MerR regulator
MRIGEFASHAGVSVQTVRFYERQKLLPDPERSESGYRIYDDEDLHRLRFIRHAKGFGFSLDEIRDILKMREQGQCPCNDVISIAEQHLQRTQRQIRQLRTFASELTRAVARWKASGDRKLSADVICTLIERTMETEGRADIHAKRRKRNVSSRGAV